MKKVLKILLILASIGAIFLIGFLILGIIAVQDKYEPEQFENKTKIVENQQTESIINTNLIVFLENPIDLQDFKKKKGMRFTTSVTNGTEYYFNPKIKDSLFYVYYYPAEKFEDSREIDQIIVFKHGENKHRYEDQTETLIEFRVFNKDSDLGKANLIGLSKTELESEFGNDYLIFDNGIAYSHKNKVLILEMDSSKAKSFRYIKLNTEKIDNDLIGQIIK
ncbi:MAG: hypothetical protein CMC07_02245 [Flavobacteriaceae bacterium]|nr:hypothetical protein [Flavobacteriaceae bacterium]